MYCQKYHVHFVGIGGIGMSGIAELLCKKGYKVSGSDITHSNIIDLLKQQGITIFQDHQTSHIEGADVIVKSSAIPDDNPEIIAGQTCSIPIISRAEMLWELMRPYYSIAVSGAHGKTTTTAIIGEILSDAGLDPTIVVGGQLKKNGVNIIAGNGKFFVAEADESDGSMTHMFPTIAVVTNIDREHMDYYQSIKDIQTRFKTFIQHIPFYGSAILCSDNKYVQEILPFVSKKVITYGVGDQATIRAENIRYEEKTVYTLVVNDQPILDIALNLPGEHNVLNSLAGIAVGQQIGLSFETMGDTISHLHGVKRRLDWKGKFNDIPIIDDYGHHPTEIIATLQTLKKQWPSYRLLVVFQPHRFSRTKHLFDDFVNVLSIHADKLFLLPIYSAGESPSDGISSDMIRDQIIQNGMAHVISFKTKESLVDHLSHHAKHGDMIVTLGAGDVWKVGELLLLSG